MADWQRAVPPSRSPLVERVDRALQLQAPSLNTTNAAFQSHRLVQADSVMLSPADASQHPSEMPDMSEAERMRLEEEIARLSKESYALWKTRADKDQFDEVKADLEVYRLSGETVSSDPRRTPEYREKVLEGLGLGKEWREKHPALTEADVAACREVLSRKAAAFWLEGTPRTTVRFVKHDTIPTGAPVCTPPHNLGQEAAQWVDEKLESEVARGQLVRGDSPWGSPPFPVGGNEPAHKKVRKRRLVVDYRRVNARVARSVYYCKRLSDVLAEVAGVDFRLGPFRLGFVHLEACVMFKTLKITMSAQNISVAWVG